MEALVASLSAAERSSLIELSAADRAEFTSWLKAHGVDKLGHRLRFEMILKQEQQQQEQQPHHELQQQPKQLLQPSQSEQHAQHGQQQPQHTLQPHHQQSISPASAITAAPAAPSPLAPANTTANQAAANSGQPPLPPPDISDGGVGSSASSTPPMPSGRLSDARRAALEKQAGPFAPPLREAKHANDGEVVRVNGRAWALLMQVKMGSYTVQHLDGSGRSEALHFSEVETTGLTLNKFRAAQARWDARAPLARKTLADDRRGHVHKSWTGPALNTLRLTEKPAPGKGYYSGVVPSVPVLMPPRIAQEDVAAAAATAAAATGEAAERSGAASAAGEPGAAIGIAQRSGYYYAHRRKIDFHVPTPEPRRIEP